MVNKTTCFKKKGKGKKGNFKKNGKQVATPLKKPKKLDPILKLSASTAKELSLEAELPQILGGKEGWQSEQRYI